MYWPEILHMCSLVGPHLASLNKYVLSLRNTFNSPVEPSTGIGNNSLDQMGHGLGDLGLEVCFTVVRAFVYLPLTNAQLKVIAGIAVRWARGPDVLRSGLLQALLQPCLHLVSIVGRCTVLLEHIMTVSSNAPHGHQWLYHCVHHMDVRIRTDPQTINIYPQILLKIFINHFLQLIDEFWCPDGILSHLVGLLCTETSSWSSSTAMQLYNPILIQ